VNRAGRKMQPTKIKKVINNETEKQVITFPMENQGKFWGIKGYMETIGTQSKNPPLASA